MLNNCKYLKKVPVRYFLSKFPDLITNYLAKNDYYYSDESTFTKLYEKLGLTSFDFVKGLYNLGGDLASSTVSERFKSSEDFIMVDDKNHFIVCNDKSITNFNFLIDYINCNYTSSTQYESSAVFFNEINEGGLINYSFITEKLDLYSIKYVDGLFFIDKSVSIDLYDDNFSIIVKSALINTYIPIVNLEIKLTYYEYIRVIKICKLKYKKLFTDEDFNNTFGLKSEQLKTLTSNYTVRDALKLITDNLESIDHNKLLKFYKNLYNEKFYNF